jgi:uncharacterized protein YjiS (DUF1127 family)
MPTEPTNLTSETGSDAAELALSGFVNDALVATRPTAAIAALPAALPEKDAVGPPAASTQSFFSLLRRYWRAFQERRQRQRLRTTLRYMSERELMDIGLTHAEIDCIAAHRALDRLRDRATYL